MQMIVLLFIDLGSSTRHILEAAFAEVSRLYGFTTAILMLWLIYFVGGNREITP